MYKSLSRYKYLKCGGNRKKSSTEISADKCTRCNPGKYSKRGGSLPFWYIISLKVNPKTYRKIVGVR